jgi:polar amino acid transport system substrate-binding protein
MARRIAGALLASVAGLALAAPPAPAAVKPACVRPFSLGLHEHGLLYEAQTGEGIDKDIADELARRSGCRIVQTVLPRARIWQLIETGALDFSLSAITNPERDRFAAFAWYDSNRYYLLVRKDADVRSPDDLARRDGVRLGAIRAFRYGTRANALVDRLDADGRVDWSTSLDPLFATLLANHIQAMVIEPFDYPVVADTRLQAQTAILAFDDPPIPHGLVMSRHSIPPEQQAAWRALVDEMRADGTIRRIFEKYFPPDLARTMTTF